jgi:hypothetical protein
MTLRLALLILLLVNGVLLAANTGVFGPEVSKAWFESEREPDRMRRQIRTEEIRILEPAPAAAPAAGVPKSAPGSSPAGSAPAASGSQANIEPAALTTAAIAESGGSCTELGGLTEAQATRGIDQLKQLAGVDILHVPYKSNPLAITDLMGGQINLMVTDMSTGVPQIKAGKLRALGYSTPKRSPQLPDVPTIAEAGVKGYDMGYWFAAYAPAHTPAPVVAKLNQLLRTAVGSPAAASFFDMSGSEAWTTTPQELAQFQAVETTKWGQVIKAAGITPE